MISAGWQGGFCETQSITVVSQPLILALSFPPPPTRSSALPSSVFTLLFFSSGRHRAELKSLCQAPWQEPACRKPAYRSSAEQTVPLGSWALGVWLGRGAEQASLAWERPSRARPSRARVRVRITIARCTRGGVPGKGSEGGGRGWQAASLPPRLGELLEAQPRARSRQPGSLGLTREGAGAPCKRPCIHWRT